MRKGEDSTGMIMITQGGATYSYSVNKCRRNQRLESGHWLCEASLWTYWIALGDAKATVHSRVLVVFADMLEKVFAAAPASEFIYVQRHAQSFVESLNGLSRDALTDFIDPLATSEGESVQEKTSGRMQHFVQRLRRTWSLSCSSIETCSDKQQWEGVDQLREASSKSVPIDDTQQLQAQRSSSFESFESCSVGIRTSVESDKSELFQTKPSMEFYV